MSARICQALSEIALSVSVACLSCAAEASGASSYCNHLYSLTRSASLAELPVYDTLSAGHAVFISDWEIADGKYREIAEFSVYSIDTPVGPEYCDANTQMYLHLAYALYRENAYLHESADLASVVGALVDLEPDIGRQELTIQLYKSLLATAFHAMKIAHEPMSTQFVNLVQKYGTQGSTP